MRTQSPDTSPDAERVQIERRRAMTPAQRMTVSRAMTPAQRMTVSRAMTRRNIRLSLRAIRRAQPDASDDDVKVTFIAVHYGRDLAERVRAELARRRHGGD